MVVFVVFVVVVVVRAGLLVVVVVLAVVGTDSINCVMFKHQFQNIHNGIGYTTYCNTN